MAGVKPADVFKRHSRGLHALVLVAAFVERDGIRRLVPAGRDRHLLAWLRLGLGFGLGFGFGLSWG